MKQELRLHEAINTYITIKVMSAYLSSETKGVQAAGVSDRVAERWLIVYDPHEFVHEVLAQNVRCGYTDSLANEYE